MKLAAHSVVSGRGLPSSAEGTLFTFLKSQQSPRLTVPPPKKGPFSAEGGRPPGRGGHRPGLCRLRAGFKSKTALRAAINAPDDTPLEP